MNHGDWYCHVRDMAFNSSSEFLPSVQTKLPLGIQCDITLTLTRGVINQNGTITPGFDATGTVCSNAIYEAYVYDQNRTITSVLMMFILMKSVLQ